MDSTLDVFMKKLQMDKVMNLDPEKISQLFMVSHSLESSWIRMIDVV